MNKVIQTLFLITIFSGIVLSSSIVSADNDSVVDEINITVPISCTISGTGMNTHNANINNGIYTPDIGTTTLHAFCNDSEGFAIYAAGYTGDEVGGTNSNKLVGTAASNNATIETGLATTAGNPDISNWAMKLAITQDSGDTTGTNAFTIDSAPNVTNGADATFSQYHVVPNEYVKVAHKDSNTDMTASTGGVKLTTTYAAYISKTQSADTYSGQVIYALVHPSSHVAPGELDPNADNISEVEYMQQFAIVGDANRQAIIDSMVLEQQYTVQDIRDGKSYTIAKYQAGTNFSTGDSIYDVWMTKNLDLDIDSTRTYTNEDTDIGYNENTGEYDTATWTPTRSTYQATSTHIHEWCVGGTWNSQYGYCETNDTPESYDPGNLYWNTVIDSTDWEDYYTVCDYSTSTPVCNQSENPISTYVSGTGTQQYHLGNYYNWAAALATNDSSIYDESGVTVEQSICPAGWTLPRATREGSFRYLWKEYGYNDTSYESFANIATLWGSPLYFATSGSFNGALHGVGEGGYFWSSQASGTYNVFAAYFYPNPYSNSASASSSEPRGFGHSVRCIVRPAAGGYIEEV